MEVFSWTEIDEAYKNCQARGLSVLWHPLFVSRMIHESISGIQLICSKWSYQSPFLWPPSIFIYCNGNYRVAKIIVQLLFVKDDLEHNSYGSGLVGDTSSAPCLCVGSAGLLSCSNLVDSWRGWLHRGALSVCPVRLLGQLGSKKPQTGTSIVNSSFGQESYSFVLCVLTLLAQPRYYLFNRGTVSQDDSNLPRIPQMWDSYRWCLPLTSTSLGQIVYPTIHHRIITSKYTSNFMVCLEKTSD